MDGLPFPDLLVSIDLIYGGRIYTIDRSVPWAAFATIRSSAEVGDSFPTVVPDYRTVVIELEKGML